MNGSTHVVCEVVWEVVLSVVVVGDVVGDVGLPVEALLSEEVLVPSEVVPWETCLPVGRAGEEVLAPVEAAGEEGVAAPVEAAPDYHAKRR